jgi:hypothetical protein
MIFVGTVFWFDGIFCDFWIVFPLGVATWLIYMSTRKFAISPPVMALKNKGKVNP